MAALIDFPTHTRHRRAVAETALGRHNPHTRSAVVLLREARAGIVEAQHERIAAERYAAAYLAALRAAAAMLALRGRPHRGRARPTSAWVLLAALAPEFTEWADFFAAGSARRAAVQAGVTRGVTQRDADDMVRQAAQFTDLVGDAVDGRGLVAEADPKVRT